MSAALPRLSPQLLAALPATVARPAYDRTRLAAGIVHIGLGAFARAHLAACTEAAIAAQRAHPAGPADPSAADDPALRWGIVGASLRHADAALALNPQQGLYTLALRDADRDAGNLGQPRQRLQVIGCLITALPPAAGAGLAGRIADPAARIVSLTITEKGYADRSAGGNAIDALLAGLALRRQRGGSGLTLLSLDNLAGNGDALRRELLARADESGPLGLARWIELHCTAPNSMVDRIVPRATAADLADIAAGLGCEDAAAVVAEPFLDWVVEDRFAAGRPPWERAGARHLGDAAGVRLVEDARPYERLKLRLVNASHSALAYLGQLAGIETVDAAIARPELSAFVQALMRDEMAPTLSGLGDFDTAAYRGRLIERFANPALRHRTAQIAMDGSQKLPPRLLAALNERLDAGQPVPCLALAVAAWLQFIQGHDEAGRALPLDDPLADALRAHRAAAPATDDRGAGEPARWQALTEWMLRFEPVFGALAQRPAAVAEVARQWALLSDLGAVGAAARAGATLL